MFSRKTLELIWEEEIRLWRGMYVPLCSHNSPIPNPRASWPSDPLYELRHRGTEQKTSSNEPASKGPTFRMIADPVSGKIWYESTAKEADTTRSQP